MANMFVRIGIVFYLLLCGSSMNAQDWERKVSDPSGCCFVARSVKVIGNGVYTIGNAGIPNRITLTKFTTSGDSLWTKFYTSPGESYAEYFNYSPNGLVVCGYSIDTATGVSRILLFEVDTLGNLLIVTDSTLANSQFEFVESTADLGYIACGFIGQQDGSGNDILVVKFDKNGTLLWSKEVGSLRNDVAHMVHETSDGGFIVSGDVKKQGSEFYDNYLLKLSSTGEKEWDLLIGDEYNNGNQAVVVTSSGDYLLCGEGSGKFNTEFDVVLAKVTASGELEWFKKIGGDGSDAAFNLVEINANKFLLTGYSTSYPGGGENAVFLASIDGSGTNLGVKYFIQNEISIAYDLAYISDTECYLAGVSGNRQYLIRTGDSGYTDLFPRDVSGVSMEEKEGSLLLFPNPALDKVELNFKGNFNYEVRNSLAQLIRSGCAVHTTTIDISNWNKGVYLITVINGKSRSNSKLVVN